MRPGGFDHRLEDQAAASGSQICTAMCFAQSRKSGYLARKAAIARRFGWYIPNPSRSGRHAHKAHRQKVLANAVLSINPAGGVEGQAMRRDSHQRQQTIERAKQNRASD
jgi:hypothetical protein